MTRDPAVLKKFIEDAEREKCVEFLLSCSPQELREMWPTVRESIPLVLEQDNRAIPFSSDKEGIARRMKDIERSKVLGLAVLATGSCSDMKKLPWGCDPLDKPDILIRLLRGVEVNWLASWVDFLVENRRNTKYECLIQAGFCKPPNTDNYVLGFFSVGRNNRLETSRIDQNFLDVVAWKFFEVEGGGDRSLAAADKYTGKEEFTWAYALKKLSEEGKLSRARLLNASLDALARDFAQFRAGWFSRFHDYMEPSADERAERVGSYLKLLASSIPPTVSFALHALKIVDSAGKLPANDVLQQLPPVLLAKNKGTVLAALGLLEVIAAKQPQMRTTVVKIAVEGFVSEIIQVHDRIVRLLTKYSSFIDDPVRKRLTELAEALSPSSRKQLGELIPKTKSASPQITPIAAPDFTADALASPLASSRKVTPISGTEELIEKASYLLEHENDLTEAERVFDGLVQFPLKDSPSFQKAAQPLLKRARQLYEKNAGSPEPEPPAISTLALLIYAWLLADDIQTNAAFRRPIEVLLPGLDYNFKRERQQAFKFHFLRLSGILKFILDRVKLPLLSTPTHLGFWIDPRALVDRISRWHQLKIQPDAQDVVVAFLRLGNESRNEALASARGLSGELGAALRYALGSDEIIGNEAWMWIAASRARFREDDDLEVKKAFPNLGPGAAVMPKVTWEPRSRVHKYKDREQIEHSITFFRLEYRMQPTAPLEIPLAHFPVLLHSEKYCFHEKNDSSSWPIVHSMPRWAFRAFLSYWPSWREPIYFNGLLCCGDHTTYLEVSDHSVFLLFDALGDPYEEFHPNARLLLNFGLSCLHADGRASAVNAFVSGISNKRLSPTQLGQSMQVIFTSGLIHPARVRKSLDEIVRVSPVHRRAALDYLTELVKGDPAKAPDNMVKLLELYHELLLEHEERVRDADALTYLKAFPGGGRAAKLAKQIAGLSS